MFIFNKVVGQQPTALLQKIPVLVKFLKNLRAIVSVQRFLIPFRKEAIEKCWKVLDQQYSALFKDSMFRGLVWPQMVQQSEHIIWTYNSIDKRWILWPKNILCLLYKKTLDSNVPFR